MIGSTEIKYFTEVAQSLNVTKAAQRLRISQPTLSYALKKLESELDVKLFVRTKSGVILTKAGERVLQSANNFIDCWDGIALAAKNAVTEIKGRFTVGCHVSVALYTLPHFLMNLIKDHPGVEISLIHGWSRDITSQVIDRKLDFGLVINPISHPDLVITELCKDKVTFWQAKNIRNPEVLICDLSLSQAQTLLKDFKAKNRFSRVITSASLEVVAKLTSQGCGVGILPERVVKALEDPGVVRVGGTPIYLDQLSLIRRADQMTTAAHKVIINHIKAAKI